VKERTSLSNAVIPPGIWLRRIAKTSDTDPRLNSAQKINRILSACAFQAGLCSLADLLSVRRLFAVAFFAGELLRHGRFGRECPWSGAGRPLQMPSGKSD
jgi:hypothetical protein